MTTPSLYTITLDTGHFTTDGTTTLLDAALTQGVPVPFSCQRGECGSCRATVVDGCHERLAPPTERTYVTADDELLMCQCRAAGDLALRFPHWREPALQAQRREAVVVSRVPLTEDVTQLIVQVQGEDAFAWQPGQHVEFLLEDGSRRPFSLSLIHI